MTAKDQLDAIEFIGDCEKVLKRFKDELKEHVFNRS